MYAGTITNYLSTPVGIMVLLAAFVIFYFLFLRNDSKPQEEIGKVVLKEISRKEVEKHNKLTDLWFVVDNQVYDVTKFVPMHPGGDKIGKPAGGDATLNFWKPHHPSRAYESLMELRIGYVPKEEKILREISKEDVKRHGNRNNACPISDESLKSLFGTRLQALVLVESCPSKPLTFDCLAIWRAVNLPYTVSCVRVCFTLCDSARLTERSCL